MSTGSVPAARAGRPPQTLRRVSVGAGLFALAAVLSACHGVGAMPGPAPVPMPDEAVGAPPLPPAVQDPATVPAVTPPKMMPGRIHAPGRGEAVCPSLDFEQFIRAFFNSGDLQVRYTARPVTYKVPYYEYHSTEPGDPANPQWETYERDRPMHDRYRYDPRAGAFVWDTARLQPGQLWSGVDVDGTPVDRPVVDLTVRHVSRTVSQVIDRDRIMTFNRHPDCWYFTADWTLDPLDGCEWPEQCRAWREYEEPATD